MPVPRLIAFDLDGTLIDRTAFIWQTIHHYFGSDPELQRRHHRDYFAGRISYRQWAEFDIAMWKKAGANRERIGQALSAIRLMPGVRDTLKRLQQENILLTVVSGSLQQALEAVLPDYRRYFSDILINHLRFNREGEITGVDISPFDIERKGDGLRMLAEKHNLALADTAFIGDNFNDLSIAEIAGFAIAFNCKSSRLATIADVVLPGPDLRSVLPYLLPNEVPGEPVE